jgi:serine-type D-Ala-D-Ala carboxypeptidase (penicillin-binding protein 5/6)
VPGQTSSAYDLALIGRAALELKDFRTYVATKQVDFPGRMDPKTKKRATYKVNNHNKLLYNYDGTIGVKNGYTEAANRTFISAVTRGSKTYLLTEMYGLDSSWRPQAAMYDWAFAYGDRAGAVGDLVAPGTVTAPPAVLPSTTSPDLTDPATGAPATSGPTRAAAAIPASSAVPASVTRWRVPAAMAVVLLLLAWGVRARRRTVRARGARRR